MKWIMSIGDNERNVFRHELGMQSSLERLFVGRARFRSSVFSCCLCKIKERFSCSLPLKWESLEWFFLGGVFFRG